VIVGAALLGTTSAVVTQFYKAMNEYGR